MATEVKESFSPHELTSSGPGDTEYLPIVIPDEAEVSKRQQVTGPVTPGVEEGQADKV